MALINRARPITDVLKDEKVSPRTRRLLNEIRSIKSFIEDQGLKPTHNYTEYVHLNRSSAVWVVSACEPLRFRSKHWSFPLVGSFPYLGWFDLDDAQVYADELKTEGWDVDLRGAAAYSTLGWFRDAILSTMISENDDALGDLVNVVIHESVHATLYIQGQTFFNESLASFVAEQMTPLYLSQSPRANANEKAAYSKTTQWREKVEKHFHLAYLDLDRLYRSELPDSEKTVQKNKILRKLKTDLNFNKKKEINNATLIQYRAYNTGQNELMELYKKCQHNWKTFLAVLGTLTSDSFAKTQEEDFTSTLQKLNLSEKLKPSKN